MADVEVDGKQVELALWDTSGGSLLFFSPSSFAPPFSLFPSLFLLFNNKQQTPGNENYDRLRPLSYPDSHVILVCFSVKNPDSLENVKERWIDEVLHFCKGLPYILVGCKKDLRDDAKTIEELAQNKQRIVSPEEGNAMAQTIGAYKYMECSARCGEGIKEVFEDAARAAIISKERKRSCLIL